MRQIVSLLALVLMFAACEKDKNNDTAAPENNLYGRFGGTFYRTGSPDSAEVSILFKTDNTFEGSGNASRYPAICGGSFQQDGSVLTVNDTCTWTADFDWTLIFDGTYNINFTSENSVRIWRTNGTITDEYLLNRFIRN
jgi:hypothetical protein